MRTRVYTLPIYVTYWGLVWISVSQYPFMPHMVDFCVCQLKTSDTSLIYEADLGLLCMSAGGKWQLTHSCHLLETSVYDNQGQVTQYFFMSLIWDFCVCQLGKSDTAHSCRLPLTSVYVNWGILTRCQFMPLIRDFLLCQLGTSYTQPIHSTYLGLLCMST